MNGLAQMIGDSAQRLIARYRPAPGREWRQATDDYTLAVAEAGVFETLVPEALGGLGLGWADAGGLAAIWGREAAPLAIVERLLAPRIARMCGLGAQWEQASAAPAGSRSAAWWPTAPGVLVIGQNQLRVMRVGGLGTVGANLAGEPRVALPFAMDASLRPIDFEDAGRCLAGASALQASMLAGAMETVVAIAIDHAGIRMQFGRRLDAFQAVQRMLALAAAEAATSRAVADAALHALDRGAGRFDALAAHAQAARSAGLVASYAHQILGAIGFTEDHHLHIHTKRLWSWRDGWMRQPDLEAEIGARVARCGGDALWPLITESETSDDEG